MSNTHSIVDHVRSRYGAIASSSLSSADEGVAAIAHAFGYSEEDLASLPDEANMGLSCGNPLATANLQVGEVVVDLGSGGGLDVFLAAQKVGPTGKAIGIDMTPEMIERAQKNAENFRKRTSLENVEFHLARMEAIPLEDASVDCLISNCVINLAPDKGAVFREMFRILKPGGRVAISDIALKRPLPEEISRDVLAYVGCVAGAVLIEDYEAMLKEAGFQTVQIIDKKKDLQVYDKLESASSCCGSRSPCADPPAPFSGGCCGPEEKSADATKQLELTELLRKHDVNQFATSVQVYALKPNE